MADIKFSEFPKATTSKDSDEIAILQDGVNKMIPSPVLESKIINKTVSRVIDQGGASLNLINPIGVVPTYAYLATITPTPSVNDAYQVEADGLVYVYTESGFQTEGEGFKVQPDPTGVVEEGNTQAVSGGEVYDKSVIKENIEQGNLIDNITDGYITSTGSLGTLSGTQAVWLLDIEEYNRLQIGGFIPSVSKNIYFYDIDKLPLGSNIVMNRDNIIVDKPLNAYYISFTIKTPTDVYPESIYIKGLNLQDVKKIPDLDFLKFNYISDLDIDLIDLSTLYQEQLFDKNSIIVDRAINNSGVEVNNSGSACSSFIKIKSDSNIFIRKELSTPAGSAWYDENKNFISYYSMPSGNILVKSPSNAVYFRLNIYNSSTPDKQLALNNLMVSVSDVEFEYKSFVNYVNSIKGVKIYNEGTSDLDIDLIDDYILPFANYNYKKTIIEQGGNSLINIGLFGDSWTDSVPDAINYVKELTILLREKYGFGGAGWYDFANSQGSVSAQKMGCANNEDADDIRTGTITYVDGTSNALGINLAHALFGNGSSITLNILKPHQTARIYYYGGGSYGNFTYKIGSGSAVNVDTSTTVGLQYIDISLNNTIESIEFNVTGNVILFGVDLKRNSGIRINKFGNRGILANNYMNVNRANLIQWITYFNLDSATLLIGTNDRTSNRTPTQFNEYMEYFYSLYYEALPYSELGFISPSNNRLTAPLYPMIEYVKVIRDISIKNNIPFINLIPLFGSTEKIINKGTFFDTVHPTEQGGKMIANYIMNKLFQ